MQVANVVSGGLAKGNPEAKIAGVVVVKVVSRSSSSRGAYAQAATREPEQYGCCYFVEMPINGGEKGEVACRANEERESN